MLSYALQLARALLDERFDTLVLQREAKGVKRECGALPCSDKTIPLGIGKNQYVGFRWILAVYAAVLICLEGTGAAQSVSFVSIALVKQAAVSARPRKIERK